MEEKPARLLYPKKEAAYLLGISVRALDYLIADKRLNTRRVGKRVLVPASELHRFTRSDHHHPVRPHLTIGESQPGVFSSDPGGM